MKNHISTPIMEIDQVLPIIGDFGFQQRLYFLLGAIIGSTYVSGQMLQIVYSGAEPQFICSGTELVSVNDADNLFHSVKVSRNNSCINNNPKDCESITYVSAFTSLCTEWDLICSEANKVKEVQSMFMAGVLAGAFIFGYISDAFGRLRTMRVALFFLIIASFLGSLAPTYRVHLIVRAVAGFLTGGTGLVSYVWATEFIGPSQRGFCGIAFQALFPIGITLHSLAAYLIPYWRNYIQVTTCYGIIFLVIILVGVPESPRWLVLNGKLFQAKEILEEIAIKNGTYHKLPKTWHLADVNNGKNKRHETVNISILMKNFTLRVRTLIQIFSWFVNSLIYYGLTLASGKLGSNLYLTTTLSGLIELPAYAITVVLLNSIGRRKTLCGFMIAGAITCFIIEFLPHGPYYMTSKTTFGLLGKMFISASFAVIFVHSAELFPTCIRNVGMGITSVAARLGGIFAPYTVLLDDYNTPFQYLLLGVLALAAGLLNYLLPETLGQPLPETIEDIIGDSNTVQTDKTSLLTPEDSHENV